MCFESPESSDSIHGQKSVQICSLVGYLVLSVWLARSWDLMFQVSQNARLELCGEESLSNIDSFTKTKIAHYSFVASALACKVVRSAVLVIAKLSLLGNNSQVCLPEIVRVLDSVSFVLLLVACSLYVYKILCLVWRVRYFGL